jgi:glycerol-3-phosphate dehydrogenase subunit B
MPIESDVVVVGGGLAGMVSALAAAREGVSVRLLSHKQSTLRMASGLIDVLGYVDADEPLADPFEAMESLPAGHPYVRLGTETVRAALALFDSSVDGYAGADTDRNALVPTHTGTVQPTARYPASMQPGLASRSDSTLFVGFEELPDFDAPLVAERLATAGVPFSTAGETVSMPGTWDQDLDLTAVAHALDGNKQVEADGTTTLLREALAEQIRPKLGGADRVGLPAVLGTTETAAVRDSLATALSVDIFEVPMGPPSIPGIRLETQLQDALAAAGVARMTGNPVVDYRPESDGKLDAVVLDRNGASIPVSGSQFILATGGLVGKGIASDRSGVREPLFDCYVPHAADRSAWFEDDVFGDHKFAELGVVVDDTLRPQTADRNPEFDNLRAAGAVIGGHDLGAANAAAGVSITTGYEAGRVAAREVSL